MFNLTLILVFAIIVFVAFLLSICAILLYLKRRSTQQPQSGKTGDELDESQAAEIISTWNNLNPP